MSLFPVDVEALPWLLLLSVDAEAMSWLVWLGRLSVVVRVCCWGVLSVFVRTHVCAGGSCVRACVRPSVRAFVRVCALCDHCGFPCNSIGAGLRRPLPPACRPRLATSVCGRGCHSCGSAVVARCSRGVGIGVLLHAGKVIVEGTALQRVCG